MPFCSSCRAQIAADARYCPACGAPAPQPGAIARPDDENPYRAGAAADRPQGEPAPPGSVPSYLVQAILVTICCCLPFGIVSIVYAAQVNGKLAGGDIAGAMESSRNAKLWAWIGFGCGVAVTVLWILMNGVIAVAGGGGR